MKISMITACALVLIIQEGRASEVTTESTDKDIAVDCVAKCNAHYYKTQKVSSFDKTAFPLFSMAISESTNKPKRCHDLINALTAVENEKRSVVAGGAKACISYVTQTICNWTPESIKSCHAQCMSILNDACAAHL